MANLHELPKPPVRLLLSGFPGSGKTGALACLANAGWKLRIIDMDGNYDILAHLCNKDTDVDIVSLEDPLRMGSRTMAPDGIPTAFINADKMLDRWRYKAPDGEQWTDLGASREWGPDHIVVLDGLTGLSSACWYRAIVLTGSSSTGDQRRVYQVAADEQLAFIRRLTNPRNKFHFICISHLKLVGPQDIGRQDDEAVREFKKFAAEAIPTRLYPTAIGRQLSQQFAGEFPTHVRALTEDVGGKIRRSLCYLPTPEVDLKVPVAPEAIKSLGKLEAADGLLKILAALGHSPPTPPPQAGQVSAELPPAAEREGQ